MTAWHDDMNTAQRGDERSRAHDARGRRAALKVAYLKYLEVFVIGAICLWCARQIRSGAR